MATPKRRKSTTSSGSRTKKPVRFVKASASSKSAAPEKKRSRPATTSAKAATSSRSTNSHSKTSTRPAATRSTKSDGSKGRTRKETGRKPVASKSLRVAAGTLPSWRDLANSNAAVQAARPEDSSWLGAISTARFVVIILAVATLFTLYVGHVFATQDLLAEVQQLRNEQLGLEMNYDKLQGELHHATGPEKIFAAAAELGLADRLQGGEPVFVPAP